MDFAKKQLEKYGWKEGEGLGREKTGISKAIRPKLKFDTGGLGHDVFEDINNTWWQRLYDEAAKNIVTKKRQNESVVLETINEPVEITTKKLKLKKKEKSTDTVYKDFVKTSELTQNEEKKIIGKYEDEEPEAKKEKKRRDLSDLTDEELFKICGGRTAHKGARHGLQMNAKLARIKQQESDLGITTITTTATTTFEIKNNTIKLESENETVSERYNIKKKKKRKSQKD